MQTCLTARLTVDDEQNNLSKPAAFQKDSRINTYKMCICWFVYGFGYDARYIQCRITWKFVKLDHIQRHKSLTKAMDGVNNWDR